MRAPPALRPVFRSTLSAVRPPSGPTGGAAFHRPIFRLVVGFCERSASSETMRRYVAHGDLLALARAHPGVELVVRRRAGRHPILKACYATGRDKVVCVRKLDTNQLRAKVGLLLDASGLKMKPLARRAVESTNESVRGIWSALHDDARARALAAQRGVASLPPTTGKA